MMGEVEYCRMFRTTFHGSEFHTIFGILPSNDHKICPYIHYDIFDSL